MTLTLSALQKQRRDTAANWTAENPTLLAGEIGIESDTGKIKIGNGSTAWASLGYQGIIPSSGAYPLSQLLMPSGTASVPSISFDGDTNLGVYRSGTDQLGFATAGTERMRIDAAGQIEAASLGTAAAPTYSWIGDPNSGVYSPGADQVAISTNGTERMRLDSSGRLGLGTASPGNLLELKQDTPAFRQTSVSESGGYVSTFGLGYSAASTFIIEANATGSPVRRILNFGEQGSLALDYLSSSSSRAFIIKDGSTERARIDISGRLLVGTSSQSGGSLLQVNDNRIRIATAKTPASATDTGVAGEICWDANYVYVCTATNTWKRTAISTW